MVREYKTKADALWFALSFALGKVSIGYRYKVHRAITEGERSQVCDDTIRELRRRDNWAELDEPISGEPINFSDGAAIARLQHWSKSIDSMCGRFTAQYAWPELVALYDLTLGGSNLQPRYNVCPTQTINTIVAANGQRQLTPMRWGLVPSWWKKTAKETPATFNARAETVAEKPMFRSAFKRTRCLIPVSGYYEWMNSADGKQPFYFTPADAPVLTVAGLWDEWKDIETGEPLKSCTMLITQANEFVSRYHDRMPVLLEPDQFTPWLAGTAGAEILKPSAEDLLHVHPVSKRVNSSRTDGDDATLIEPITLRG